MVGYQGHRPGSNDVIGASSLGGVPYYMETNGVRSTPGMGFGPRPTTSYTEIGGSYGKRKPAKTEIFAALAPDKRGGPPMALDHVGSAEKNYVATFSKPNTATVERAKIAENARKAFGAQMWEKKTESGPSKTWQAAARSLPDMQTLREMCRPPDDVYIPPWEMTLSEIYGKETCDRYGLW